MNVFEYVYSSNLQGLREYLELGDVNVLNERGMSLIHYAILFNNSEIFDLLLENYININIMDKDGNTPVHYCVTHNRMGFLKTLIRHGANLTIQNLNLESPLYVASRLGRENMIYLLLENIPFNIHEKNINDESIFMALIRSRNLNLLNKVIVNDEMLNERNYLGETPLHIACKSGDIQIVRYLLDKNAYVNVKNKLKETPLFYAVRSFDLDIVSLLLEKGACPYCQSSFGDTIFDLIEAKKIEKELEILIIRYKADKYMVEYPLHYTILTENYSLCLKHCVIKNINRKDKFGFTPMELSIIINNDQIINLLKNFKF